MAVALLSATPHTKLAVVALLSATPHTKLGVGVGVALLSVITQTKLVVAVAVVTRFGQAWDSCQGCMSAGGFAHGALLDYPADNSAESF